MMESPASFYDTLASVYDGMTDFDARLRQARDVLSPLLARLAARVVVDMACGTGVHTIAMSELGSMVTGIDISEGMLGKARSHASRRGSAAVFLHGGFESPILRTLAPIDTLVCLGNSIPHAATFDEVQSIFRHWNACLRSGGTVLLQLLNYARVLRHRERVVAARRAGDVTTVRFYDFVSPDALDFNILILTGSTDGPCSHELHTTRLLPITADQIVEHAHAGGFKSVDLFADLSLRPYDPEERDLVVLLTS
jgi:glycine/sarcosine N-methyltransferase